MLEFRNRLALVTGAGDGIGAMLAKGFASWGMRVCVQDIRAAAAEAVASDIGNGAFPLVFDVSDRSAAMAAAETLKAKGEPLSLLWINAGAGVGSSLLEGKQAAIEWAYSVNVMGLIWSAQAFVPLMDDPSMLRHVGFTASSASLVPPDGDYPLYAVTKHGAFAAASALRAELQQRDIASTILCPGLLNTNIWDGARARPERFGGVKHMDPAISGLWKAAKHPEVMWPSIEKIIAQGGGYLTCATDLATKAEFKSYVSTLEKSIINV